MGLWQSNRYIKIFRYRFYYKVFILKFFPSLYRKWRHEKALKKRRLNKKNGRPRSNWARNRLEELAQRDGRFCQECLGNENLTVDHIIPLWKIGALANKLENLQILCRDCHTEKERLENKQRHYGHIPRNN